MEAGGVAALEVVARDLKALGLYQARALSYDGVEVEILEHPLSPAQRRIYDSYTGAFKVIHHNITEALKATGIVDGESTLNKNAKSAAMSAFEGAKQRFFGHLLTSMKCPSLIRAIEEDLDSGHSPVVQLVSTGEALMERRIAEIPASEWDDINVDLTPRETVIEFLAHAFPVQLQEPFTDDEGNVMSRPVFDEDGSPVVCQEAAQRRDALIEKLAALPPVPSALDQVVQHFGHDAVAEVTGMPGEEFGKRVLGRPQFVEQFAVQQTMTLKTADRLLQFLGEAPIGPVFRREVEAFLDVTAIRPAKLSTEAAGYPWFVGALEEGGAARLSAVERVRAWMVETATPSERAAIAGILEDSGSTIFNDGASTSMRGERRQRTTSPVSGVDTTAGDHPPEDHCQMFLTTNEAAKFLRLATRTLDRFRAAREGPPYCKLGKRVYYARADLLTRAWTQRVKSD